MYNIMNEGTKVFGCSSLSAVVEYITEVGVSEARTQTNAKGQEEICIFLRNDEHVIVGIGCPTAAHDWIVKHVPGNLVEIVNRKDGSVYRYK